MRNVARTSPLPPHLDRKLWEICAGRRRFRENEEVSFSGNAAIDSRRLSRYFEAVLCCTNGCFNAAVPPNTQGTLSCFSCSTLWKAMQCIEFQTVIGILDGFCQRDGPEAIETLHASLASRKCLLVHQANALAIKIRVTNCYGSHYLNLPAASCSFASYCSYRASSGSLVS